MYKLMASMLVAMAAHSACTDTDTSCCQTYMEQSPAFAVLCARQMRTHSGETCGSKALEDLMAFAVNQCAPLLVYAEQPMDLSKNDYFVDGNVDNATATGMNIYPQNAYTACLATGGMDEVHHYIQSVKNAGQCCDASSGRQQAICLGEYLLYAPSFGHTTCFLSEDENSD